MGKGRKRLSGAKRREIKKKWKARTFLERDSESSEDNGKMNDEEKKAPPPPPPSLPPPPPDGCYSWGTTWFLLIH